MDCAKALVRPWMHATLSESKSRCLAGAPRCRRGCGGYLYGLTAIEMLAVRAEYSTVTAVRFSKVPSDSIATMADYLRCARGVRRRSRFRVRWGLATFLYGTRTNVSQYQQPQQLAAMEYEINTLAPSVNSSRTASIIRTSKKGSKSKA